MPRPTKTYIPGPLAGLNSSPTSAEIADGQCSRLENLRLDLRGTKYIQRLGQSPLFDDTLTPNQDLDMVAWYKLMDTEYLLGVHDTNLYDLYTNTIVSGGTACLNAGGETNSIWFDSLAIIGNGLNSNIRFDGVNVIRDAVQQPNITGIHVSDTGLAGNPTGTYIYRLVYLNGDGVEGEESADSPTIAVAGHQIALSGITLCPAGQNCSGTRIYRTKTDGARFFR